MAQETTVKPFSLSENGSVVADPTVKVRAKLASSVEGTTTAPAKAFLPLLFTEENHRRGFSPRNIAECFPPRGSLARPMGTFNPVFHLP